jgi:PAS domain S-box-containing protein
MMSGAAAAVVPMPGTRPGSRAAGRASTSGAVMLNRLARIIVDSISDGVFTVDKQFTITYFNKAAERITGFRAAEAIGKPCFEIFRTEVCHSRCAIRDTLSSDEPVDNVRVTIITQDGREVPISLSTEVLKDEDEEIVGVVEFFRDLTEVEHAREALEQERVLEAIVSASPALRRVIQMLPNIAVSECNVTIHGPSGSGKELFAEAIHKLSPRRYGPYIRLNCAALPATLLESELFGYVKGAFTDAKRDKPGLFALANGGTLLLDEISEMEVSLQVKLLRVLSNGEYQPLGGTRTLRTDARVIAATNADLKRAIAEGRFREDLYFRINVVTVELPPLRERPEDIPLLVDHFMEKVRSRVRKPVERVAPQTVGVLQRYSFPGNVRELQNAIEHAFVMCDGDELLPEHLPGHITADAEVSRPALARSSEKQIIEEALRRHHGNRSAAASELRMHRSTLWRKLKTYRIGT